jgi:hypothetical protein
MSQTPAAGFHFRRFPASNQLHGSCRWNSLSLWCHAVQCINSLRNGIESNCLFGWYRPPATNLFTFRISCARFATFGQGASASFKSRMMRAVRRIVATSSAIWGSGFFRPESQTQHSSVFQCSFHCESEEITPLYQAIAPEYLVPNPRERSRPP